MTKNRRLKCELKLCLRSSSGISILDPALLLEFSRIGNNINQIARGLNILKKC
ncbi:plasmid mobilization relaxosome protein MobC [Acinetobacter baumannii]|uniref:plasmid mobilization relaxosome protein MobC n=1 Tax=Acinetobacter baumannii TaxID=470 RepID=UPI00294A2EC2|nr:plasmid mobilization relaxosome protein MobC [Acinetobacter baumannii]MDV5263236.1 plasmid mobilization relaxosome protein MobC [Acinetobacter baumannii]